MTKIAITYLSVFLTPILAVAQDYTAQNDSTSYSKHNFSVEVGVHRSLITGKRYIDPNICGRDVGDIGDSSGCCNLGGFTINPVNGFQFNALYDYSLHKNLSVRSGVSVFNRIDKFESDSATIADILSKKYYNVCPDPNIIKYKYSSINIEIPLYIGYKKDNFSAYFGIKALIAAYRRTTIGYVNNTESASAIFKFIPGKIIRTYFDFKLYYLLKNSLCNFKVFAGVDFNDYSNYYFQSGINITLLSKQ